jgi:hypothetical protein
MHKRRRGMFILCSPTKGLVDQTTAMLREAGGKNIHCIHGDCSEQIPCDVQTAMKAITQQEHGTLLITNATFDRAPYFRHQERWDLILDEIPRLDTF